MDIGDAVTSCVRLITDRAKEAGVTVRTEIANDLPALAADERKIKQILINLLSNAVKFTPVDGDVTVSAHIGSDGAMDITVRDSGIGMEASEIPRALEPFAQVDGSLSRKHEGTGLGLPLAKMLCELHGGHLQVDSIKDQGTTISLQFPKERVGA
jgi:two-component system cell cycle sensor histidine kinase PleC